MFLMLVRWLTHCWPFHLCLVIRFDVLNTASCVLIFNIKKKQYYRDFKCVLYCRKIRKTMLTYVELWTQGFHYSIPVSLELWHSIIQLCRERTDSHWSSHLSQTCNFIINNSDSVKLGRKEHNCKGQERPAAYQFESNLMLHGHWGSQYLSLVQHTR